ncbi:hypothetical protein BVX97_01380 [bacterium E08(2017)]|nr:hypothetical protein BVX97_01380 [bacterium E08(2017)]
MKKRLMVVDDEELILKTLERVLVNEGYDIITASSGEEALAKLELFDVHVFMLDLNMPGMSGVELCGKIREKSPLRIIYALTGYVDDFTVETCRSAGFDDYFTKPFKVEEMLEAAEDAFDKLLRWEINQKLADDS